MLDQENDRTAMPPKPFPFKIGIGTDICEIERMGAIIQTGYHTRWARKVLTYLEWPSFETKLQEFENPGEKAVRQRCLSQWMAGRCVLGALQTISGISD